MHMDIETVDTDGAIRETAAAAAGDTRAQFFAKAGLLGGGIIGSAALIDPSIAGAATKKSDVAILNYALTLEYLEAAFYTRAERKGALTGELARFAKVVGAHERAHVMALKQVLGRKAVARPRFDFQGTTEDAGRFAATAQVLEDTGVAAYAGQAPKVKADAILKAALAIHSVEARHAGWIRDINGEAPAPEAFDAPLTRKQVLAAVADTGFIVPRRRGA
ncbi:MAG: ferritin-like domain-containing protein [Solirubrobacteraceae bacterium]